VRLNRTVGLVEGQQADMNEQATLLVLLRVCLSHDVVVNDNGSDRKFTGGQAFFGDDQCLRHPELIAVHRSQYCPNEWFADRPSPRESLVVGQF
jgi:hypothetical protein